MWDWCVRTTKMCCWSSSRCLKGDKTLETVGLFIVADGMGGHQAGEVASALAARTVARCLVQDVYISYLQQAAHQADQLPLTEALLKAVETANQAVHGEVPGSGTTLTCALVINTRAYLAHVGDSRAYLYYNQELKQVTRDHSYVDKLVELGQITIEAAAVHPQRNVLYRAVGQGDQLEIDIHLVDLPAGQSLVVVLGRSVGHVGRRGHSSGSGLRQFAAGCLSGLDRRRQRGRRPRQHYGPGDRARNEVGTTVMNADIDYYATLNISADATAEEIRAAYRQLARQVHPDMQDKQGTSLLFRQVQEAYETLSDPIKRAAYDRGRIEAGLSPKSIFQWKMQPSRTSLSVDVDEQVVYLLFDIASGQAETDKRRQPLNLCLVLDRSTSMQGTRLEQTKAAAQRMIDSLSSEDTLGIVTYSDKAEVVWPSQPLSDPIKAKAKVSAIQASGGTEILQGCWPAWPN